MQERAGDVERRLPLPLRLPAVLSPPDFVLTHKTSREICSTHATEQKCNDDVLLPQIRKHCYLNNKAACYSEGGERKSDFLRPLAIDHFSLPHWSACHSIAMLANLRSDNFVTVFIFHSSNASRGISLRACVREDPSVEQSVLASPVTPKLRSDSEYLLTFTLNYCCLFKKIRRIYDSLLPHSHRMFPSASCPRRGHCNKSPSTILPSTFIMYPRCAF